ncbi:phage holin [Lactobacillus amylovorus]|uniref:phage holin n=1 Tax=Lactobacillus amylovorus TaxID=1604 RepID=UPI00232DFB36|nr:phage holin [Lactobacillus amylovorus]MDB6229210.1 phage holin [Lactobacillus amylovorus]
MTVNQILDLVITVSSVALTVVVAIYAKHKVAIDKQAQKGNLMAKAEQIVAQSVAPLVYQAEKDGGDGADKFTQVLNEVLMILDLAHLPHPSSQFIGGEIEKAVTAMKQTQGLIDSVDGKAATSDKTVKSDPNA